MGREEEGVRGRMSISWSHLLGVTSASSHLELLFFLSFGTSSHLELFFATECSPLLFSSTVFLGGDLERERLAVSCVVLPAKTKRRERLETALKQSIGQRIGKGGEFRGEEWKGEGREYLHQI